MKMSMNRSNGHGFKLYVGYMLMAHSDSKHAYIYDFRNSRWMDLYQNLHMEIPVCQSYGAFKTIFEWDTLTPAEKIALRDSWTSEIRNLSSNYDPDAVIEFALAEVSWDQQIKTGNLFKGV